MMDFHEFSEAVVSELKDRDFNGYDISLVDNKKNNGVSAKGVVFRHYSEMVSPIIYLEYSYNRYVQGEEFDELVDDLYKRGTDNMEKPDLDMDMLTDWDHVRGNIHGKIVNYDTNKEYLEGVPYIRIMDMAVIFQNVVFNETGFNGSITVTDDMMKAFGITLDDLKAAMLENDTLSSYSVLPLGYVLKDMMGDDMMPDLTEGPHLYVVSNERKINGATAFMYTELFRKFADKNESDVAIIPSSIHELLIIPMDDESMDIDSLNSMVKEVNATTLDPVEILSNHVYIYSRDKDEIVAA